ncbi:MFS transporter [Actinophytocola oryzae]|uniref:Putative MFS family arabinose efflux permease n=1 Tax=Actinophytocola oryzae TaxID=502181 RepID=A0A4R7W4U9_9PSEU|nr:MFS transporter [Actinophytocola oryzae]TDV57736.1 putative MFS family arabinose efflux permease [Actinophytocola oryzae]
MSTLARLSPVMAFSFIHYLQNHMVKAFVPLYAGSLGASLADIGVITAATALTPMVLAVPIGLISDRHGIRAVFFFGSLLSVLAYVALWLWPNLTVVLAAQVLAGTGQLMIMLGGQARVAGLAEKGTAEKHFSVYTLVASAGQILGPIVAGILIAVSGYHTLFLCAAALGVLSCGVTLTVPSIAGKPVAAPERVSGRSQALTLLRTRSMRIAILISCLMSVPEMLRISFLPIYLQDEAGLSVQQLSWVLSLFSGAGLAARLVMPTLVRKWGRHTLMTVVGLVVVCALLAMPLSSSVVVLALLTATLGLAFGTGRPLSMAVIAGSAPPHQLGMAVGLRLTGNRLADFLTPIAFGAAASVAGVGASFVLGAILAVGGTSLLVPSAWRERRTRKGDNVVG